MKIASRTEAHSRRLSTGLAWRLGAAMICLSWLGASSAEKLVDPNTVAPEYRAAAEQRRAEQIKIFECGRKADIAKIARRDRAAYVNECIDK